MTRDPQDQPLPRRALVDPVHPDEEARRAWQPLPLDTTVKVLAGADLMAVNGADFVVASIEAVDPQPLALDLALAAVYTWRNGGDSPRHRERQVPEYTTVESVVLAHAVMPTAAFYLPGLRWRGRLSPLVIDQATTISLAAAFARLPRTSGPREAAIARVAEIRALYGRMLADIAYRIENSAFFDSTVATTRQFQTALALWSDVTSSTSDEEVIRRSALVTVAFDTARANAETIGELHLPHTARGPARRAAGAARLANSSTTEAERDAAHSHVVSILRSLALDCLPDPAALPRAITAPPRPNSAR